MTVGGRGNGEKDAEGLPRDAEGLPRSGSKEGSGKGEVVGWTGRMGAGRGAMGRQRRGGGPFGRGDREGGKGKEVGIWSYRVATAQELSFSMTFP